MALVRSLKTLLQAFGTTPAAGMTFHVNVPDAPATRHMSDYILTDWNTWASSDVSGTHASGSLVHFTFNFVAGAAWIVDMRGASPVAKMTAFADIAVDPNGRNATVVGGSWAGSFAPNGQSVTVQLTGQAAYGTYSGGSGTPTLVRNYYKDYTSPDAPGAPGSGGVDVDWEIIISLAVGTYVPPSLTADTFDIVIQFPQTTPYLGNWFNPELDHRETVTVSKYDAGPAPANTITIEYHSNSSFTNLLFSTVNSGSYTFTVGASNPSGDVYARYRQHPTDAWTSYPSNPIHYHDVRY